MTNGDFDWRSDDTGRRWRIFGISIGLLYLAPVVGAISGYGTVRMVLGALGLTAFVVLYYASCLTRRRWIDPTPARLWPLLAGFTLLALGLPVAFDGDWLGLPIYVSIVYAVTLPAAWALRGVVAGTVFAVGEASLFGADGGSVALIGISSFAIGMMMLAFRQARSLVQELQAAQAEVSRLAATDERLRIARDLHDLLGNSLSLIVLKTEVAGRLDAKEPILAEVADIRSVARQALADVRAAVSTYRRRSLAEELANARTVLDAAGVEASVRLDGTPLPEPADALLAWALREGVTNVVRHAHATRCAITVTRDGRTARLRIADNGTGATGLGTSPASPGFGANGDETGAPGEAGARSGTHARSEAASGSQARTDAGADCAVCDLGAAEDGSGSGSGDLNVGRGGGAWAGAGNGLTGLSERSAAAGGSVRAESPADGGFVLTVRVPLDAAPVESAK